MTDNTVLPGGSTAGEGKDSLVGQYRLLALLGRGGMGTVYKALHLHLKKVVALKMLAPHRLDDRELAARFHREMEAVGRVDHPHVVAARDAGVHQAQPFLVMEFLEGADLAGLVKKHGPLPESDACELVRQAALGLAAIHQHHLVHRDIKPSNLFLTRHGQVKVLDLGLSLLHEEDGDKPPMTHSNQLMGTADYMAPEQGVNSHNVDIRADIYSLGCTLYFLLTGKAPFTDPSLRTNVQKVMAHNQLPVPPILQVRPDLSAGVVQVLGRMLAKDPSQRQGDPQELIQELIPLAARHEVASKVFVADVEDTPGISTASFNPETSTAPPVSSDVPSTDSSPTPLLAKGEPGKTPPPAMSPLAKRMRAWAGPLAAVLVGAVLCGYVYWANRQAETTPRDPEPAHAPASLEAGVWHDLLKYQPRDLVWKDVSGLSDRRHDARVRTLWVQSTNPSLFGLGSVPEGSYYRFQVDLSQTPWVGFAGLFFGYRETEEGQGKVIKYQTIELRPRKGGAQEQFALWRSWVKSGASIPGFSAQLCGAPVPLPVTRDMLLEITVNQDALIGVRIGGQDLLELAEGDPLVQAQTRNLERFSGAGRLGVYVSQGSCAFRNARLQWSPK